MNRYRQKFLKQNCNALRNSAMEEYGIGMKNQNADQKRLRSKSKSNKDILIAKNKKLPDSFKTSHFITHEIKSPRHKQVPNDKKQDGFLHIQQKNSTYYDNKEEGFDGQKTSAFGNILKLNKENTPTKITLSIAIRPETYAKDRFEAFELRQKLKKSTSMRNLTEPRFLYDGQSTKNQPSKVYEENRKEPTQQYDSRKYNWRLSKSKEKLYEQKSLSTLSSKAKIMYDLKNKGNQKNKLTLDHSIENRSKCKLELKSQQILSFEIKEKGEKGQKKESTDVSRKKSKQLQNLSYTFGSDVMKSIHFN